MTARAHARRIIGRYFEQPGARFLNALRITPNAVSFLGLAMSMGVALLAGANLLLPAGLLLLVASAMDLLDGALARLTDQVSRFGALLDSTFDRLAEAIVLLGLLVLSFINESATGVLLVFLVLVASFMVSYLRARGEALGLRGDVGLMTRPERVIALAIGMIANQVLVALAIILLLSTFTAGQRFLHLWRETTEQS